MRDLLNEKSSLITNGARKAYEGYDVHASRYVLEGMAHTVQYE